VQSIDLNLLPVAQALLAERSVTRAAARLHLSVPATSRALDRCRHAFGDPLLVRAGRSLAITPRGAELLAELDSTLESIARTLQRPTEFDPRRHRATYTIRANEVIVAILAGPWLEIIAQQAPDVQLRFENESTDDIEALRRGEASFAIGSYGGLTEETHHQPLVEEHLVGMLRAGHPLAGKRITPTRFAALRHVVTSRRGIARGPIDELLEERGLRRDIAAVVPSFSAAVGMCVTSDLTTLAPRRLLTVIGSPSTMVPFMPPLPLPVVKVEVIWHRRHHHDPPHQWLRRSLHDAVSHTDTVELRPT
jgi:DNA-binding transcriptional LysR family regulator